MDDNRSTRVVGHDWSVVRLLWCRTVTRTFFVVVVVARTHKPSETRVWRPIDACDAAGVCPEKTFARLAQRS